MAIGPSKVMKEAIEPRVRRLEAQIDEHLSKSQFSLGNNSQISINLPTSEDNDEVWKLVKKKYVEAGWSSVHVRYYSADHREPMDRSYYVITFNN